jgi:hypothetical protein
MDEPDVVVSIGARRYAARLIEIDPKSPGEQGAIVTIAATDLLADAPDLAAALRIFASGGQANPTEQLFSGHVVEAAPDDAGRWRLRAAKLATWHERITGAASFGPNTGPDILWSIYRSNGVPPAEIPIPPNWSPKRETFAVAVPIEGVEPVGEVRAGPVRITADHEIGRQFGGFDHPDVRAEFDRTGVLGVVGVTTRRMHDAEQEGLRVIGLVVNRLAIASRFSLARVPAGELRAFRRAQSLERLRLVPVVGVHGTLTGRRWLRGYAYTSVVSPVLGSVVRGLERSIATLDERIDEAINAWRRATSTDDPTTAVIALAEACEFYANGVEIPHMFTEAERVTIREQAIEGLEGARRERVTRLFDRLNDPSFRTRLVASLKLDEVPHDGAEVKLLTDLYAQRSKILHGSERKLPTDDELRQAIALVNRMIVFRLHRLDSELEPGTPASE